jgi:hypothetical protein
VTGEHLLGGIIAAILRRVGAELAGGCGRDFSEAAAVETTDALIRSRVN